MLKHPFIDKICIFITICMLLLTLLFMRAETLGIEKLTSDPGYVLRLFDSTRVHTVDIVTEDWQQFLENAAEEKYQPATIIIDGEVFSNVGLRAKGNNSLRLTKDYGLQRYSLKIEFDHYEFSGYYGLDKFSLDASFQDNSYMKNRIAYDMMEKMGVPTPLTSYAWVRVNGKDIGLFLAVEEPEEAFAERNFGSQHGKLYKPDYRFLSDENADVALRYTDDDFDSYDNIFRNAKFDISSADKKRLIRALKILSSGENLSTAVDIDSVLSYFAVQVFVVNMDSYLGKTGHNYFLYEKEGKILILPWDYNLAFATYSLGMPDPIDDAQLYVNYPINTPASGKIMRNRPLYHNLMKHREYFSRYHQYFDHLISDYFESGYFENFVDETHEMIGPYVRRDPTAFCSYEDYLLGKETLKQFCLLRAQSVRKQLEGKIPPTIKGQLADKSGFVDASSIRLPDMGELADLQNPPRKEDRP